ncbi:hypothetical protein AB205_0192830 [Aquarana catesbeiana]|uniref:Uncharacterized protein n=1 Tax=Aquarana catesbeiana TaxID=8400 RepID=A0A2G9RKU6_AQUCT|nr:hypothetical protein AB205_0192830 [Aquarana catesbeiana]
MSQSRSRLWKDRGQMVGIHPHSRENCITGGEAVVSFFFFFPLFITIALFQLRTLKASEEHSTLVKHIIALCKCTEHFLLKQKYSRRLPFVEEARNKRCLRNFENHATTSRMAIPYHAF